ncbi:MAG: sulfate ABC transporter ATP-binding protein [Gemmatimonadetes bacterium]|nr:sulfate ABC transporter ATP-binding protein [Gemmatimonadota bacterium]
MGIVISRPGRAERAVSAAPGIRVERLTKRFGAFTAVDDVSFDIPAGELVAMLGPSGGGKSTILRIIAGLEQADGGSVWLDGLGVDHLPPRERRVGFVFQHYALFRHMTVEENIGYALRVRRVGCAERRERVAELVALMGLHGLERRYPSQLSGGQRQRVALARSLAARPRLLLLDEPFAAVDARVREELRHWLRRLHDEVHVTSIFVTHDQEEAFALADRVLLIHDGRLEQDGSPLEILDDPATEFVARFIGDVNVLDGVVRAGEATVGALRVPVARVTAVPPGERVPVRLVIRSYDLKFWRAEDGGVATVRRVITLGDRVRVEAMVDQAGPLFAQFPRRSSLLHGVAPGVRIGIEVTAARAYPLAPGARPAVPVQHREPRRTFA